MLAAMLIDPAIQLVFRFPSRLSIQPAAIPNLKTSRLYDPTAIPFGGLMVRTGRITGERKEVTSTICFFSWLITI